MSWWCKHQPEIIERAYAPPYEWSPSRVWGADGMEMFERSRVGVTTTLLRCKICGELWQFEALGRVEKGTTTP